MKKKAFDDVEHFATFEAVSKINIDATYVKILQNIYSQA